MSLVPRQTVLNVLGLITTPNEFGVYPEGACSLVENFLARAPNVWQAAPGVSWIRQMGSVSELVYRMTPLAAGRFLAFCVETDYATGWSFRVDGDTATALTAPFPIDFDGLVDASGYLEPIQARDRLLINTRQGVLVLDELDPSNATERTMRLGGMGQAYISSVTPTTVGPIPNTVTCGYTVNVRRKLANGYTLISPSSPTIRCRSNNASGQTFTFKINWPYDADLAAGDEVRLYRTAGIVGLAADTDPGTSARNVATVVLSAADVAAHFVNITDNQPCVAPLYEATGEEIYTSPYREGGAAVNLQPPVCRAMAQWGDYTFYGNVTDDPEWLLDVPAGIIHTGNAAADTDFARTNGVGTRTFTCTRTSGSPTVTGVSASHLLGIVPGQNWDINYPGFPSTANVVSVGATSITFSENATSSGTDTGAVTDRVEINGVELDVIDLYYLSTRLAFITAETSGAVSVYPSETIVCSDTEALPQYQLGVTLLVRAARSGCTPQISVRGTNGANYSPAIPEIDQAVQVHDRTERPNVFRWSKQNQPEAVSAGNEGYAGAGTIIRMLPTTDQLWVLCTDGLRRLTGAAGQWRVDMLDPSVVPVEPGAACVMFDTLYVYTPRGIVSVDGSGKQQLTRGVVDNLFPGSPFAAARYVQLMANTTDQEIFVLQPGTTWGAAGTMHVYSALYGRWSSIAFPTYTSIACGAMFDPADGSAAYPIFGSPYTPGSNVPDAIRWPSDLIPLTARMRMQPWYASDPLLQKQWVDVTVILETGATPNVSLYLSGELQATGPVAKFNNYDNRATFGVSKNHAINQVLQPGIDIASGGTAARLKGLSVRLVPLTNQPRGRQ